MWSDDLEGARNRFETLRGRALERGDESTLPLLLAHLSAINCLLGTWETAARWADESYDAAVQTGQLPQQAYALAARALVDAHLGFEERTRAEAAEALALERATGAYGSATSRAALALLELSLEEPEEVHKGLGPVVERYETEALVEPGAARFLPDEIEALVALGDLERAHSILAQLEERARRLGRRSALAASARCRGLLSVAENDLDSASASFGEALESYAALQLPFERARTLLALGVAQRRGKQRQAGRKTLEEALAAFDELGAMLWRRRFTWLHAPSRARSLASTRSSASAHAPSSRRGLPPNESSGAPTSKSRGFRLPRGEARSYLR
jgi:tetratricopeptide (TPR) repeat protein